MLRKKSRLGLMTMLSITALFFNSCEKDRLTQESLENQGNSTMLLEDNLELKANPVYYGTRICKHKIRSSSMQSQFNSYKSKGYRLIQIDAYVISGSRYYTAVWDKNPGPKSVARFGMSSSTYQSEFNKYKKQGYRLSHINGCGLNGKTYYSAIWEKKSGPAQYARHGMSSTTYQSVFNDRKRKGYKLAKVSGYSVNGKARYAAIWEKRSGSQYARHGMSSSSYQSYYNRYTRMGYRLTQVVGYPVGNKTYYAAIWDKKSGPAYVARHGLTEKNFKAVNENQSYKGYRVKYVSAYKSGSGYRYAGIWENTGIWDQADINHIDNTIKEFMSDNDIPGASLALAKNGKLIYAQAYGKADKANNLYASPSNKWRIASISKPVTAVAIMKLVEQGKLKLTDKVFGKGAILGTEIGNGNYSEWVKDIEVQHLLEHTAGGTTWNNKSDDGSDAVMTLKMNMDRDDWLDYVIDNVEPSHEPGSIYSYSNVGYSILGRIIEKKTGYKYESWVKRNVTYPSKAYGMQIGANSESGKRYNEVVYYNNTSTAAYKYDMQRLESFGGWIATPIDLLRFSTHVDGKSTVKDILNSSTISTMTTASTLNSRYAKGWNVNSSNNWWHNGSLTGSRSILVRTNNGYTWSLIINKKVKGLDGLMWEVKNGIKRWPSSSVNFF